METSGTLARSYSFDIPFSSLKKLASKITFSVLFFVILYAVVEYKLVYFFNTSWGLLAGIYSLLTSLFLLSRFVIVQFYKDDHAQKIDDRLYPNISIVIACKNEEGSILDTIYTCMESDYPGQFECIVIDDGSTDKTVRDLLMAKRIYKDNLKIMSFPKHRGKREGMSEGILAASNEIIVFVDSDSFLKKDALKTIVQHFIEDKKVGAISGNTHVENVDSNLLTRMQAARYGVSFDIFKAAESVFGAVTCCPGCFSAYRKEAILAVMDKWRYLTFLGTRNTYGDDRSLTNFVLRDWKVIYCESALATTVVPEKFKQLFKQQLRWKKSWIKEGIFNAGKFVWKKHPIASLSFYSNLIIPIFGPIIVFNVFFIDTILKNKLPLFFISGVVAMSLLFGIYYHLKTEDKYWWYVTLFTLLYTFILVWQMPYAILKLRDTGWGTR